VMMRNFGSVHYGFKLVEVNVCQLDRILVETDVLESMVFLKPLRTVVLARVFFSPCPLKPWRS
jgi:hypothetical protein